MADGWVVETTELQKHYPGIDALRGLDLRVPEGSICGLLGRNGAGKTTTLKILLGMTRATGGQARVLGLDAASPQSSVEIRRRCGFVSEEKDLYEYMTVEDTIRFTASFFPRWRRDLEQRYLREFDLPRDRQVRALSRGMRTKLALLVAFSRGAELLLLDEPTSGLDPAISEEVLRALIAQVADEGTTVVLSSHLIAEVDQIADRVVIIDRGRAVVEGELDELRRRYCRIQLVFDGDAPDASFRSGGVERIARSGRVLTLVSSAGSEEITEEARALDVVSMDVIPMTLKEIFLESTAREA